MTAAGVAAAVVGLLVLFGNVSANEESAEAAAATRDGKVLPIFQVVKFQNAFCTSSSTSRNGTCYTAQECATRGGTAGSECAEGFGVCCSFQLTCGGTSSENATYIINTSPTESCSYTICPCSTHVCRIRFDFETLQLADPFLGTAGDTASSTAPFVALQDIGAQIGDCATDQFSVTGKRGGSPTICGKNTGQHMIVDADNDCHTVQINVNTATSATRSWTIHVSQYTCTDPYSGGPPGCLQYHTATSGTISNFGFDRSQTDVAATTTHLSNQDYNICFRRGMTCSHICYTPAITSGTQNSFGLDFGNGADAKSMINSECTTDYLTIPGGTTATNAAAATAATAPGSNRVCGRFLATATDLTASGTVCSRITPFIIGVHTDADEVTSGVTMTDNSSNGNEQFKVPGGIVGFHLTYTQTC